MLLSNNIFPDKLPFMLPKCLQIVWLEYNQLTDTILPGWYYYNTTKKIGLNSNPSLANVSWEC